MGKNFILGVDPGLSGALALLNPRTNELKCVWDVPTILSGVGNRRQVDVSSLALKLGSYSEEIAFCVMEDVHSTPNDGPVGAFAFGKSTGILIGVVGSMLIPIYFSPPSVWKNCFGLSSDKNKSRELAIKKYPTQAEMFKRKKDDGRAEAALLAEFGKRFC
jgi:crossover junction endodeoxyribonuclease RuvC